MTMNPADAEILRHAALDALALRHPTALTSRALRRAMEKEVDFSFTDADLASALEVLRGKNLAAFELDPLGSTQWWTATADGKLATERSAH